MSGLLESSYTTDFSYKEKEDFSKTTDISSINMILFR